MRVRLRVEGSILCDADSLEDTDKFQEVLDDVCIDGNVHGGHVELLEITETEPGPAREPQGQTVYVDPDVRAESDRLVSRMAENVLALPAFQEAPGDEEFEKETGIEIGDPQTWGLATTDLVVDALRCVQTGTDRRDLGRDAQRLLTRLRLINEDGITYEGYLLLAGRRAGYRSTQR